MTAQRTFWWLALASLLVVGGALPGCSLAGPYGFARHYVPLSEEEDAAEGAVELDPVMASRDSAEWQNKTVSFFGVVKNRREMDNGLTEVIVGMVGLQERNLCDTQAEDSCRVTVTDHEFTMLRAHLKLQPRHVAGEEKIAKGSLLRIVGKIEAPPPPPTKKTADDKKSKKGKKTKRRKKKRGGPTVTALYYRHWPYHYYRTLKDRDHMRL